MSDLRTRLQAAAGGSAELSEEVMAAVVANRPRWLVDGKRSVTESLNDAWELAESLGYDPSISGQGVPGYFADVDRGEPSAVDIVGEGEAKTPALALCAALVEAGL